MSEATLLTLVGRTLSKVKELLGISQRDSFPRTLAILAQYPICPEVVGYFAEVAGSRYAESGRRAK